MILPIDLVLWIKISIFSVFRSFCKKVLIVYNYRDARDLRFTCSRLALLSVLRSWAGTIEFCDPNKPSGMKAIVDVLYLNQLEVRVSTPESNIPDTRVLKFRFFFHRKQFWIFCTNYSGYHSLCGQTNTQ